MKRAMVVALTLVCPIRAWAVSGVGPKGIDATQLQLPNGMPLNGAGIGIG